MQEGILDYVAHSHHISADVDQQSNIFGRDLNLNDGPQLEGFLKLADIQTSQSKNHAKDKEGLDHSNDNEQEHQDKDFQSNETFKKLLSSVENHRNLPFARLNLKFIKPADRATYLLNYLYMQIQRDQLLVDNFQQNGNERLNTLKECFLICSKPYLSILNDWICKGDDNLSAHDLEKEFFIKANHSLFIWQDGDKGDVDNN